MWFYGLIPDWQDFLQCQSHSLCWQSLRSLVYVFPIVLALRDYSIHLPESRLPSMVCLRLLWFEVSCLHVTFSCMYVAQGWPSDWSGADGLLNLEKILGDPSVLHDVTKPA